MMEFVLDFMMIIWTIVMIVCLVAICAFLVLLIKAAITLIKDLHSKL